MSEIREILRDEFYNIISQPDFCIGKSLSRNFPDHGSSLPHDPDAPVITISRRRDYRRTSLNEIDHAARFILIFGISSIDLLVMYNNSGKEIASFLYEDPDLFERLSTLLSEKCQIDIVPKMDGTYDRLTRRQDQAEEE